MQIVLCLISTGLQSLTINRVIHLTGCSGVAWELSSHDLSVHSPLVSRTPVQPNRHTPHHHSGTNADYLRLPPHLIGRQRGDPFSPVQSVNRWLPLLPRWAMWVSTHLHICCVAIWHDTCLPVWACTNVVHWLRGYADRVLGAKWVLTSAMRQAGYVSY